jgi:predicted permease
MTGRRLAIHMDGLVQDVKYAIRSLRKNPGVTATVLLTLALGIGANTAIFSVIDAVILRPLPYPHADRLVIMWEKRPDGQPNSMTPLNYLDYASQSTVFEHIAATTNCCGVVTLTDAPTPVLLGPQHVSASYFDILGIKPALGRTFLPGEDTPGRDHVVVLSYKTWASRFASDPAVIGSSIHLDGESYTVVGVMPQDSAFDRMLPSIWVPLTFTPANTSRNSHWLISYTGGAVGRLKAGVSIEQARAELNGIAARLSAAYPDTNKDWGVIVDPYATEIVGGDLKRSLTLLLGGVGAVLLIGCVNLANLMLARGLARQQELGVRMALGASRTRLIRQALTESTLLSAAGGALGLLLGTVATGAFFKAIKALPVSPDITSRPVPAEAMTAMDVRVLLFSLGLSLACMAIFAALPAAQMIRGAYIPMLGAGYRASSAPAHRRLRRTLVAAEVALACVLLTCAGLLFRSFSNMQGADFGFDASNVVTAVMPIRNHRFSNADEFRAFIQGVRERLERLPGIRDVAIANSRPTQGSGSGTFVQVVGRPSQPRAERTVVGVQIVSPSYFDTIRLHVLRGRALSDRDRADTRRVAVINETMARMLFGNEDPLRYTITIDDSPFDDITTKSEFACDVVGVVADERVSPFGDKRPHPLLYVSLDQKPSDSADILILRTESEAGAIEQMLRKAVAEIDPGQALTNVVTVATLKAELTASDRFRSALLGAFALTALLLAGLGIYGVTAYTVRQRAHELSIRAALGASPFDLVQLVVGDGMWLIGAGLTAGLAGGLGAARLLGGFLFGVGPADARTLIVTVGILAGVAFLALTVPARRASRVNPIDVLREA